MSYLYKKVRERFSFLPADIDMQKDGDSAQIAFRAEQAYCPYVRRFAEDTIADVIAIGYKYAFFEKRAKLPLLKKEERRLLLTALVSADFKEDRAYVRRRFCGHKNYCLDGVYRFRLRELQSRWEELLDYIPRDMGGRALEEFLGYLTEDGEGKLFVKDGKVYDGEYRVLSRSLLTGRESAVGEILLGNAGKVYCFGETDRETGLFLKKYYGEKAVFC
ncbi:MAG: hypothetical protein IJX88_04180 [Clostridia bacterium]|nr:hypothetical protein [Clostridia bacterium]